MKVMLRTSLVMVATGCLFMLFQNCAPAKVSSTGAESSDIGGSTDLGSHSQEPASSPTPAPTATPRMTPTPGVSPTPTPVMTPTPTPTPTPVMTPTPTPMATPTPTPTATPTPTPTPTPVPAPAIMASVTLLNFGDLGLLDRSKTQTVMLTNTGTATLTISSRVIIGSGFSVDPSATVTTCGSSLAVGQSCTIGVYFMPQMFNKSTGMLRVTTNAPNSPLLVQLEGNCPF